MPIGENTLFISAAGNAGQRHHFASFEPVGSPLSDKPLHDLNENGKYDPPERWTDKNRNGLVDSNEYIDSNKNRMRDLGEPWTDLNGNGIVDEREYKDLNNNDRYDQAEFFVDLNFNGAWDQGDEIDGDNGDGLRSQGLPRVAAEAVFGNVPDACRVDVGGDQVVHNSISCDVFQVRSRRL